MKLTDISRLDAGVRAIYRVEHSGPENTLDEDLVVFFSDFGKVQANMNFECSIDADFDGTIEKLASRLERMAIALRAPRTTAASIPHLTGFE